MATNVRCVPGRLVPLSTVPPRNFNAISFVTQFHNPEDMRSASPRALHCARRVTSKANGTLCVCVDHPEEERTYDGLDVQLIKTHPRIQIPRCVRRVSFARQPAKQEVFEGTSSDVFDEKLAESCRLEGIKWRK